MNKFRIKTAGIIKRRIVNYILLGLLFFSCSYQEKIKVVVNKPSTEIKAEKFSGINEDRFEGNLISRDSYQDGLRHGEYWFYHDNGNVKYHGSRFKGKLHGEIFEYSQNGELFSVSIYNNGVYLKESFYRNGMLFRMRDIQNKIEYKYNEIGEVVNERYYGKDK